MVADIGKTMSFASGDAMAACWTGSPARTGRLSGNYPALDLGGIGAWLLEGLSRYAGEPVAAITTVAHGAAVVGLLDGEVAFPSPNHEHPVPDLAGYRAVRDAFDTTGSPALPDGLNLGAQLH